MVAKAKTTQPKTSTKTAKATSVSTGAKGKKPPAKAIKKRKRAAPKPKITEQMFREYFFKLDVKHFKALTEEWNESKLKIRLKKQDNYDAWLNYFKTIPAAAIKMLAVTGEDFLDAEAFSALRRWYDIIANPHRIDKIHQSGLTNPGGANAKKSIAQLALDNDRLGVLQATRDKIAEKLDKGAGTRDTALLTREMTEIMTQIADYEKRLGPKKDTMLGHLMGDMPDVKDKRASKSGEGARRTSFRSRVTIDDVEEGK